MSQKLFLIILFTVGIFGLLNFFIITRNILISDKEASQTFQSSEAIFGVTSQHNSQVVIYHTGFTNTLESSFSVSYDGQIPPSLRFVNGFVVVYFHDHQKSKKIFDRFGKEKNMMMPDGENFFLSPSSQRAIDFQNSKNDSIKITIFDFMKKQKNSLNFRSTQHISWGVKQWSFDESRVYITPMLGEGLFCSNEVGIINIPSLSIDIQKPFNEGMCITTIELTGKIYGVDQEQLSGEKIREEKSTDGELRMIESFDIPQSDDGIPTMIYQSPSNNLFAYTINGNLFVQDITKKNDIENLGAVHFLGWKSDRLFTFSTATNDPVLFQWQRDEGTKVISTSTLLPSVDIKLLNDETLTPAFYY